jgi:TIR domain
MIAFMSEMNVVIVDYLVIAEAHRRGWDAFGAFYKGIKRNLQSRNIGIDYAIAEVDVDQDSYEDTKDVWDLYRWLKFRVVDLDYRGAPMTDNPLEPYKLALWSAHDSLSLSPNNVRRIIYCIFEWNKRWCEALMPPEEFAVYYHNFRARLAHNESQLNGATRIQLLEKLPPRESNVNSSEYPSCFISYSNEDNDFALKIEADLRNSGVECWIEPHNLPIGSKLDEILIAIGKRDKLLAILSTASINSPWVQKEVDRALELERSRNTVVLFPIRIDQAAISTEIPWVVNLRMQRNIGDFRLWKNRSNYRRMLTRLLDDLKAGIGLISSSITTK